jgi:hypothetical protein
MPVSSAERLATRVGRSLRQVAVAVTFLALAGLGVVAICLLAGAPGAGFLLAFAWVLAVPVPLQISRTLSEQCSPGPERRSSSRRPA